MRRLPILDNPSPSLYNEFSFSTLTRSFVDVRSNLNAFPVRGEVNLAH